VPLTAAHPGLIFSPSDLDRMARTPSDPLGPPLTPSDPRSCPFASSAGTARSARSPPLSLTRPGPLVSARRPRARALDRRSNLDRWF
jgi:hypothetical protein